MRATIPRLGPLLALLAAAAAAGEEADLAYFRDAPEWRRVAPVPAASRERWDTWLYMPWRHQWTIGEGEAGGRFCRDHGVNGGFTDHGEGPFAWLERWGLRFYNDHTAGKGLLHLRGATDPAAFRAAQTDPRAVRAGSDGPKPLDAALRARLLALVRERVAAVAKSPLRVAYALDDEPSWGAFVRPLPWRVHGDDAAYLAWLALAYGGAPPPARYVTPDFTRAQLDRPLAELDFSPLLDRMSFNDSVWACLLGDLVEAANAADPDTPCGIVGAQAPSLWGGYDYAKLCRKVQFLEAYDLGSAQEIARSFDPEHAMPVVTTHFHREGEDAARDVWWAWYHFAHGNRGAIGWVEDWFEGAAPRPWLAAFAPALREIGGVQGAKLAGARWRHDGVAIYYSHPSIQVSWCLDSEAHGETWVNRGRDDRLGTSHCVRKAWEYLLADAGLQYDFVAYDEVARSGVPPGYRVLVLPACYALSDLEARRMREFCERGGTLVADFLPGVFDRHGRGRPRGALDALFGVARDAPLRKERLFGGKLWVETDQEAGYEAPSYRKLFETVACELRERYAVAERGLPAAARAVGAGRAVLLNLSPQRYLMRREEGDAGPAERAPFLAPVLAAGCRPRVEVLAGGARPPHVETTAWWRDGHTYLFVVQNPGPGDHLRRGRLRLVLDFPAAVRDVVDERTGEKLGDGRSVSREFVETEALLLSYRDPPP